MNHAYLYYACVYFLASCTTHAPLVHAVKLETLRGNVDKRTSNENATSSALRSLGLAVCISGQFGRLETKSKVQNLMHPLAASHSVDVFAALEIGDPIYSELDTIAATEVPGAATDLQGAATEVPGAAEARAYLEKALHPFFRAGMYTRHVDYKKSIDLRKWPRMKWEFYQAGRLRRLSNYMNQYKHWSECAQLIEDHEVKVNGKYDQILRLRDNTIALKALPEHAVSTADSVSVKECCSWGGTSDKIMLIPRHHMQGALVGPYSVMRRVQENDREMLDRVSTITNTEILLNMTLRLYDIPVTAHSASVLPLVDGRYSCSRSGGSCEPASREWCLVAEWKDCRPARPWGMQIKTCD